MSVIKCLSEIKSLFENAILEGGTTAKNNLIRTSRPINLVHELVKQGLISRGIEKNSIYPKLNESRGEISICGSIKKKSQDICVLPKNVIPQPEYLEDLKTNDIYGADFSEKILSINVRSQMSSVAKNFDTIFERTFAEAYNLHNRLNKMVLGEVFLFPIREFDDTYSTNHIVRYKDLNRRAENQLEKYIHYFSIINNRRNINEDYHKYEKVCLLVVDFSYETPILYQSDKDLIQGGVVSSAFKSKLSDLSFESFFTDIINVYNSRFIS